MTVTNRYFTIFVISLLLFVGNNEAQFWKSPASGVGTRPAIIGAANPGLAIGAGTTGQNIRYNAQPRVPNPGTEVGRDIIAQRPFTPKIGGTGQDYRNWAADLTGAGNPPLRIPTQGPTRNGQPNVSPGGPSPFLPAQGPQGPTKNRQPNVSSGGPPPRMPAQGPQGPTRNGQPDVSPGGPPPRMPAQGPQGPTRNGQPDVSPGGPPPRMPAQGPQEPTRNSQPDVSPGGPPPRMPAQGPQTPQRAQGPTSSGQTQPNILSTESRPETMDQPSHAPGNTPNQPTTGSKPRSRISVQAVQPGSTAGTSASGDQSRPDTPSSSNSRTTSTNVAGGGRPTDSSRQPESPNARTPGSNSADAARTDQSPPDTPSSSSSGKSWADVAGSRSSSPTRSPTGTSNQDVTSKNGRRTTKKPSRKSDNSPPGPPDSSLPSINGPDTPDLPDKKKDDKEEPKNPTYSRGNTVTDEDLEKLSEALYTKERNNANQYITLNLQERTTSSSSIDQAPQKLLTVSTEAFQIPTIQRVLSIFDNYQLDTHTNEYISPAQREEESRLADTFLSTNVMSAAMRFLADKGFVRKDYYEYKDTLRRIWFNLFSRGQGKIGSTGFEHVFMAETRQTDSSTEVLGLHNWIYFNAEETKGRVDYLGYINKVDLGNKGSIIKMHAKFNGHDKPVTTMFVGTSPELEMALYTVCFYARPETKCPVSLGGTKFNIVTHKFRYRGKDLIGTAYPEI